MPTKGKDGVGKSNYNRPALNAGMIICKPKVIYEYYVNKTMRRIISISSSCPLDI